MSDQPTTPDPRPIGDRLDDAGRIRRAYRALDLPALILAAHADGIPAAQIARRAEVTEGYVHRIIRPHRKQQ